MAGQILLFPSQTLPDGGINVRDQYGSTDRWLEAEYGLDPSQREVQQAFNLE